MKIKKVKKKMKNFINEIKETRRRTKVLYLMLIVLASIILSIRIGEIMAPVELTYRKTGGLAGIDETYKVYREGFNYYVSLSGLRSYVEPVEYKITRNEFYRCVNKKRLDKETNNTSVRAGGGGTDSFHYYTEVRYWWGDTEEINDIACCEEIERLFEFKKTEESDDENKDKDTSNYEFDRLVNVWSDACYKYRVKNSEIFLLKHDKNSRSDKWEISRSNKVFVGENSSRNIKEIKNRALTYKKGLLHFTDTLGAWDIISCIGGAHVYRNYKEYRYATGNKKNMRRLAYFLENKAHRYVERNLASATYALMYNSDYSGTTHDLFKTFNQGDEMINFYYDASRGQGYVVYYRTDDRLTRNLLARELKDAFNNKGKREVFGNPYVVVRVIVYAVLEMAVFMYIGKRKKRKKIVESKES